MRNLELEKMRVANYLEFLKTACADGNCKMILRILEALADIGSFVAGVPVFEACESAEGEYKNWLAIALRILSPDEP